MMVLDHINARYGKDTLQYVSAGFQKGWEMRRDKMSPEFNIRWPDILRVKARGQADAAHEHMGTHDKKTAVSSREALIAVLLINMTNKCQLFLQNRPAGR